MALDGDLVCFEAAGAFFTGVCAWLGGSMPCSVQNDGSASAGAEPMDIVFDFDFARAGDGFFVSVEVLLVADPLEVGRNDALLLCFFANRSVCVELCLRGGCIGVDSSPIVASLRPSQKVISPSRKPVAIFLLASSRTRSLSEPVSASSSILSIGIEPSTVISGVVDALERDFGRGGASIS